MPSQAMNGGGALFHDLSPATDKPRPSPAETTTTTTTTTTPRGDETAAAAAAAARDDGARQLHAASLAVGFAAWVGVTVTYRYLPLHTVTYRCIPRGGVRAA